jgi:hypothetical protein
LRSLARLLVGGRESQPPAASALASVVGVRPAGTARIVEAIVSVGRRRRSHPWRTTRPEPPIGAIVDLYGRATGWWQEEQSGRPRRGSRTI